MADAGVCFMCAMNYIILDIIISVVFFLNNKKIKVDLVDK